MPLKDLRFRCFEGYVLRHSAVHAQSPSFYANGGRTMRAYLTATGMALGLLAVWAALVPLVA